MKGTADDLPSDAAKLKQEGAFVRGVSQCRNWLGTDKYPAEPNRYHLYVAFNCPWCHRVILARQVLQLQISMDVAFPTRTSVKDAKGRDGLWAFFPDGFTVPSGKFLSFPECTADTVNGKATVAEIYDEEDVPQKSVPLLFDKHTKTIVNNESAELLRMFSQFSKQLGGRDLDLYPSHLAPTIDDLNTWIYHDINNGSYKAGFTSSQVHYEQAYTAYFAALDRLDAILATSKFLASDELLTEADIRLFPTLFRHDAVYYNRFKLNKAFLHEYPNILRWMRAMYTAIPDLKGTSGGVSYLQHCKQGYYGRTGSNTVPLGPPGYPQCYWE